MQQANSQNGMPGQQPPQQPSMMPGQQGGM